MTMAIDAFLELLDVEAQSAVQGEALDKKFREKQGMELLSFEVSSQVDPSSAAAATPGTESNLFTFSITKSIDNATPDLLMAYAKYWKTRREIWPLARVTMRKAAGHKQMKFLLFEFGSAYIKSWTLDSKDGEEPPEEEIEFAFRWMRVTYWPQTQKGGKMEAPPITGGWDLGGNCELP
jgi:type VI protein secretion system component Hcp